MNKKINKEIRPQAHRYLDASPQPEELLAIALGQGRDRVLAGRIHVDIRRHAFHGVHGLVPQDAVDEHHMAIELALPHRADGSLSAEHDAHYVGLQDQLHLGRIHVHQVARLQGPSIVHQYVDGAQLLDDPVEGLVHRALAAHVAVEGKELAPLLRRQLLLQLLHPVHPAGQAHHRHARVDQILGYGRANAGAGSGNDCHAILPAFHVDGLDFYRFLIESREEPRVYIDKGGMEWDGLRAENQPLSERVLANYTEGNLGLQPPNFRKLYKEINS